MISARVTSVVALTVLVGCSGGRDPGEDLGTAREASMTVCGAPTNGPVQGVDVSHYQGAFNWGAAKGNGTVFGYASIGDGSFVDPDFALNWSNMKAAGVLRGAYQFFEPGDDPTTQANTMIQAVGQLGQGDLPCMVDVEVTGGQSGPTIAANVRTWVNAVKAGTGRTPFIYTGPSFWDGSVGDTSFGAIPLWIADYGPSCPAIPNGWSNWTIWQYGDSGGNLDQDVYNGTLAELQTLAAAPCNNACTPSHRVGIASAPTGEGTWITDTQGHVYPNGNASFFGDLSGTALAKPVVGIAATPSGQGYWLVAADGGIFSFGNAGFHGSTGGMTLNKPVVGMAAAPDGGGYWLVAADGGIFNFGTAGFFGSAGGMTLNKPVVGMAATTTGKGYWLVAADGGIFAYGDATFQGSTGSMTLNAPIVGMAATKTGQGYWLVGADGGIFGFGDAAFHGSAGSTKLAAPVSGMVATTDDGGYWLVGEDGGVFTFGDAPYLGNAVGSVCSGGAPASCVLQPDGCYALSAGAACASGQACGHGTCQSTCTDACASGASQCQGAEIQVCGHYASVPCNGWSPATACPTGQSCAKGVCASPMCSDDCEAGATECVGGALATCTGTSPGGCRTWSAPTACQAGQTCVAGGCVVEPVGGKDGGAGGSEGSGGSASDGGSLGDAGHEATPDGSSEPGQEPEPKGSCGCTVPGAPDRFELTSLVGLLFVAGRLRRRRA
jgi:GH25 family lysozyme M1 (1,4-beta-N-acetylmuramidase)